MLAPGALFLTTDFNFHIDEPNDYDARRFLQVLQLFDLTQHVSKSTHKKGHILNIIIMWADRDIISESTVGDLFISVHLAVHSSLHLAKLPLERKKVSCCKIRAIDYDEFCDSLQNSNLVRDAATLDLVNLGHKYNTTLGSCWMFTYLWRLQPSYCVLLPAGTLMKFTLKKEGAELWLGVPQKLTGIISDFKSSALQ